MATKPKQGLGDSDALRANLLETAVDHVLIDPRHKILREPVNGYSGLIKGLDKLLYELNHPFRNWRLILPEFRSFVLKNNSRYLNHEAGPDCALTILQVFLEALEESGKFISAEEVAEAISAYLDKLVSDLSSEQIPVYLDTLSRIFTQLGSLSKKNLLILSSSYHPIRSTLKNLAAKVQSTESEAEFDWHPFCSFQSSCLHYTYDFWLEQDDPAAFCEICIDEVNAISHKTISSKLNDLKKVEGNQCSAQQLEQLVEFPTYLDIVKGYRSMATQLGAADSERLYENYKLQFLFRIMEIDGLSMIHEESLKEINRNLIQLVRKQTYDEIEEFFLRAFVFLRANVKRFPHTALQSIEVLGSEILKCNNGRLVEAFLAQAIRFGFQYSSVQGVTEDWQPIFNTSHLYNIRVWMNLIIQNPEWCSTLLSALIINIKLSGTCIRDTDLFQKEITRLLNSDIGPVYNLVKQFTRLLPVFFNEIGSEGVLREVSTELDETHKRKDQLIHFLRKQSHVESSNIIVDFINGIIRFWRTLDKQAIAQYIPEELLHRIDPHGEYVTWVHQITSELFENSEFQDEEELLSWPRREMEKSIMAMTDHPESELRRVVLLIRMYQLVNLKYDLGFQDIKHQAQEIKESGLPDITPMVEALEIDDPYSGLEAILDTLEELKAVTLSPEKFEAREDIFHKRHIVTDIPSVYGRYQEKKFDALSLSFRLENLANVYLEHLTARAGETLLTQATFYRVVKALRLFIRALAIDGIGSRRLETQVDVLEKSLLVKRFSYLQYLDIFRGLSEAISDIRYTYYTNHHRDTLAVIVPKIPQDSLLPAYRNHVDSDSAGTLSRISESFERDLIAETIGIQSLDNYITRVYQVLNEQEAHLSGDYLNQLMTYDPKKLFCQLHEQNEYTHDLIHLGNKGYNLAQLIERGVQVPAGSIITSEFFRCQEIIRRFPPAWQDFTERLDNEIKHIEKATGRRFGSRSNPLLISVRSCPIISMPGMMATVHNLGINEDIVQELAKKTGKPYFAWDTYRRFIQSWCMSGGMERDEFSTIMRKAKERYGVDKKQHFNAEQMRELTLTYKQAASDHGLAIPDDPWMQLHEAINMVIASWDATESSKFRSLMDISDEWGTAVLIQAMVFGNLNQDSGTGVLFTAHPYRKLSQVTLWGDYTPGNQGEDIVGGLVATKPISIEQAELDDRPVEQSMEVTFPEIYKALLKLSRELVYNENWNKQEMEFTFEGPSADDLYLLQTRDMVTSKIQSLAHFKSTPEFKTSLLGRGIGVCGGAMSGRAVFSIENIEILRTQSPNTHLILIRSDTVPEDIHEISQADGVLTARGGQTSHASIVTIRLEKTCVVGCEALKVYESESRCIINDTEIRFGDTISIDGRSGILLKGEHPTETAPEGASASRLI